MSTTTDPATLFCEPVRQWFDATFDGPTEAQRQGWPNIKAGNHTLIAAPTGSGKTLAAFLAAIDDLTRLALAGELCAHTHVVYVSPLKALSNDIEKNLRQPLGGIQEILEAGGYDGPKIEAAVRTGDTPSSARTRMVKRPPHILVTTPESLYILLTSRGGRAMLQHTSTLIVDEIHAMVDDKRGSHLSLTAERLADLTDQQLVRIGLSATQKPIELVARFLVGVQPGSGGADPTENPCAIVDTGLSREIDLAVELPRSPVEAVMSGDVRAEMYDRLAELVEEHSTTLIFVNTRREAERGAAALELRLGSDRVASHHGSLAKEHRLDAEQRLKAGQLSALVATASLELGIDIGDVDLVCQFGSTRSISALVQRVGRSGHFLGGTPKGRLFPLSRDQLIESLALIDALRRGELDTLAIPDAPLDILAQQIVATVAAQDRGQDELYELVRRSWPYRDLDHETFLAIVQMLAEGFTTRRGRRGAHIHWDAVGKQLKPRRGARLAAITSGGAIPDNADFDVIVEPRGTRVGSLNEDFAVESMPGDIFQLGNTSWRILRVEPGKVRVEDAKGAPPTLPFWLGEAPGRSTEMSHAVSRLRQEVSDHLGLLDMDIEDVDDAAVMARRDAAIAATTQWLMHRLGVCQAAASQAVEYLAAGCIALSAMPTEDTLVAERFFDESGGMQLVVHSPLGSRINRAWGLALRKRFCRQFNFELQAAANEDAIVLSLGPTHSFPLDDVFRFLNTNTVRHVLIQALLDAPMFQIRWRWNVTRALAVLRRRGGKKVAPQLQRMQAEDLVALVFPDQLACLENIAGEREVPQHPLVDETIRDCLTEAMDIDGLERLLTSIERGERALVARDLREPSPLAHEILNAMPYAYLDDAPLEERRTQAVRARHWLDPRTASDLSTLDLSAIERVRQEAWPLVRDADELHDALLVGGFVTESEGRLGARGHDRDAAPEHPRDEDAGWSGLFSRLCDSSRATTVAVGTHRIWVAAERLPLVQAALDQIELEPPIEAPDVAHRQKWDAASALVELLRCRLAFVGPTTAQRLATPLGLDEATVDAGLMALESEGTAFQGRFTPSLPSEVIEWCDRRLLSRIHRYTIGRLRREIEPVSASDFMRFLVGWQRVLPEHRARGPEGLAGVLEMLEGYEAPAASWESELLPARVAEYQPPLLDHLALSGQVVWGRLRPPTSKLPGRSPIRTSPIALLARPHLVAWRSSLPRRIEDDSLSAGARAVRELLDQRGACFFRDLASGTHLLKSQVEEALGELVTAGLATSDGFTGLRALILPANKRPSHARSRRRPLSSAMNTVEGAGRWSLLPERPPAEEDARWSRSGLDSEELEVVARALLLRYGVIFRRLLEREGTLPPWRDLLYVYRRLEARGEIRGGRFVAGFSGEQFALPEAVGQLRAARRAAPTGTFVSVAACDPLNLVGIVTPGQRVTSLYTNRVLLRDGEPVAALESGNIRWLGDVEAAERAHAERVLVQTPMSRKRRPFSPGIRGER